MTSRTESFPSEYVAAPRFAWGRLAFTFALTLSAIILFSAAFAIGYARMNEGRVLPGVDVAGVSLTGLSRNAAAAKLRASLPSLSSGDLTVNVAGATETIPYSDFDRDYDIDFMLDQAFGLGQGGNFIDQLREQMAILFNGVSVKPQLDLEQRRAVDARRRTRRRRSGHAVDAALSVASTVTTWSLRRSDGVTVDLERAVTQAMAAINNLSPASTQITVEGTPVPPSVTTADAQAAADKAESVVGEGLSLSGAEL